MRVGFFSSASDIRFESLDSVEADEGALDQLRRALQGPVCIAVNADRIERQLVPAGFVAFEPLDLLYFEGLFGVAMPKAAAFERFEHRALRVAEQLDWLISRGVDFNRQLATWALDARPELHRLFAKCVDVAGEHPERVISPDERTRERRAKRSKPVANASSTSPEIATVFGRGGGLETAIPGYERRDGQLTLASAVADTLEHDGVLLAEAGTGIGKSLAYLVPSAIWAQEHGVPVVVSTFTRGLQEQLVSKDVPIASDALQACGGEPVRGVALKGRSNYLCLRRWIQESRDAKSDPAMNALKIKISIWLETTTTGDRAELTLTPAEERAFSTLSATTDNCLQLVCRSSFGNRCFFNRSRMEAQKAHIIVMNHALLFASLGEENTVLGSLDKLIVDEAHHLESVATSQYSFAVSGPRIERALAEYAVAQGSSIVGNCGKAVEALSATGALQTKPANARKALEILRGAVSAVERGNHWATQFFHAAARFVEDQDDASNYAITRRILDSTRDQPNWQSLYETWESLDAVFADVLQSSRWLIGELGDAAGQSDALEKIEPALLDLSVWRRDLEEMQGRLRAVVSEPDPGYVYWFSGRRNASEASVFGAPLAVADLVAGELLARTSSAVLTSATLRSQGSFRLLRQQLGIEDATEVVLPSPFDYRASTLLYIARDVPDPRHASYLDAVADAIAGLANALDGRTLALFTSHAAIRSVAPRLREQLEPIGISVLAQDIDGTANQLVERMKRSPSTVVLGVAAFWEGVDVPGDELSGLVVTRLPFDVPTDPLFAARSEQFDQPFQQYSLPRAALKFRQGFGRLIRSTADRGVVAVLDSRIFTKNYGSTFIRALPECTVRHGQVADLGPAAEEWLRRERPSG
ncbi:MAG TPA: helicase C-terminal domain-containing protein [Thermomicrobiales bacterium]|nr:helicase C-terminal domain-containing protein [Thermomicrobiales bacterium]